jgi:D-glycero-alpha-D-manno-heptose 1-phosphate guanylyltransferase
MRAIILAGGFGTRLRSVVSDMPKPLAPIQGRPFLAWLIDSLTAQGVRHVTLSVHHQWEIIRDYFEAHPASVPVEYAIETEPLGTGGALRYCLMQSPTKAPVLALNGDSYVKTDIAALYAQHIAHKAQLSMVLRSVPDSGRYGTVEVKAERGRDD